ADAAPESSLQLKVLPASLEENLNVAELVLESDFGVDSIVRTGGTESTVQFHVAVPTFPARSVALMVSVWEPWARPVRVQGLVQATVEPVSSWQVQVLCSLAENT